MEIIDKDTHLSKTYHENQQSMTWSKKKDLIKSTNQKWIDLSEDWFEE